MHGTTRLPPDGFSWNLMVFRKSVEKIQLSLKSEKNNGYFTGRTMYMYDNISLNSCYNEKCFRQSQNIHFTSSNCFIKLALFLRKCGKIWYSQTRRRCQHMAQKKRSDFHARIHTHTHKIFNTFCFSTAIMVTQTCLGVTLYVHCLFWRTL